MLSLDTHLFNQTRKKLWAAILLTLMSISCFEAKAEPEFHAMGSCFKAFPSYDAWLTKMRERNGWIKTWFISLRYDEARFNDALQNTDCQVGTYTSFDGTKIQAFIVKPVAPTYNTAPLPLVLYNRGGNQQFGAVTLGQLLDFIIPLSNRGYLVAASQYRGGSAKLSGQDEFGGRDVDDVLALRDIVIKRADVDANKQYMLGISRGAMNTFMALKAQREQNTFGAVAVIGGLVDLSGMIDFRPEMERVYQALIPNYASDKQQALYSRSVVAWPEQLPLDTPILQLHGKDDERVPVASAEQLSEHLETHSLPHKLIVFDGEDHMIRGEREQVIEHVDLWFRRHPKG